jgi:hypothetical protein
MENSNERMMILKMIEEGKVTADEGIKLLTSVQSERNQMRSKITSSGNDNQKWFRVKVTDTRTGGNKATVTLPLALMDWGLKVGSQFASDLEKVDLGDLSEILHDSLDGKIVDVIDEEDGEHVEIFID